MAATSISSPFPDDQQQQQGEEAVPIPGPDSNTNAWQSSGSIGPFFVVISVLAALAIISCILGRICRGRRLMSSMTMSPLERIKGRDCSFGFGWFRRKCHRLGSADDEQVIGNKAVDQIQSQKENNDGSV